MLQIAFLSIITCLLSIDAVWYRVGMNTLLRKLKKLGRLIAGLFPTAIPVGMTEFEQWAQSIEDTYRLPTNNKDSIRFSLATSIMHLGPTAAYKPKLYFALVLKAGAAKQIAGATFQDIKQRQQQAAANQAKPSEVTQSSGSVTPLGQK
jgi:hypothetical protein